MNRETDARATRYAWRCGFVLLTVLLFHVTSVRAAPLTVVQSFDPGLVRLTGAGYDSANSHVYVVDEVGVVHAHTASGTFLHQFTIPGNPPTGGKEWDLDFTSSPINLGGIALPANTLLATNADDSPDVVYALHPVTGALLASTPLDLSADNLGGVSYHSGLGTLFGVDFLDNAIYEFDPATGSVLNSFPTAPAGSPAFNPNFSDVEVNPLTGNLYLVTSFPTYPVVREMTPAGDFVEDHAYPPGVVNLSGLAFVGNSGEAWAVEFSSGPTADGQVHLLSGFPAPVAPVPIPEPTSLSIWSLLGLAAVGYRWRRKRNRTG